MSRTQEELREVMQALEELAVSYEGKDQDIASLNQERLSMMDELENMQVLHACNKWVDKCQALQHPSKLVPNVSLSLSNVSLLAMTHTAFIIPFLLTCVCNDIH